MEEDTIISSSPKCYTVASIAELLHDDAEREIKVLRERGYTNAKLQSFVCKPLFFQLTFFSSMKDGIKRNGQALSKQKMYKLV